MNNSNKKDPCSVLIAVTLILLSIFGLIAFYYDMKESIAESERRKAAAHEWVYGNKKTYRYSSSSGSSTSSGNPLQYKSYSPKSSSSKSTSSSTASKPKSSYSTTHKSSSSTTKSRTVDPSDHDIESYYEDYKDEFENEDDAWDDFEDNEDAWEDY